MRVFSFSVVILLCVLFAGIAHAEDRDVSEKALKAKRVMIANADQVREATGFAIGGVPPVAHGTKLPTLIDKNLGRFETLYAAAGSPRAVFPISYEALVEITEGQLADMTED